MDKQDDLLMYSASENSGDEKYGSGGTDDLIREYSRGKNADGQFLSSRRDGSNQNRKWSSMKDSMIKL